MRELSVTCPRCGATSHHPEDVEHGYCGRCHAVTTPPGTTYRCSCGALARLVEVQVPVSSRAAVAVDVVPDPGGDVVVLATGDEDGWWELRLEDDPGTDGRGVRSRYRRHHPTCPTTTTGPR